MSGAVSRSSMLVNEARRLYRGGDKNGVLTKTNEFMNHLLHALSYSSFSLLAQNIKAQSGVELEKLSNIDGTLKPFGENNILTKDEVKLVIEITGMKNGKLRQNLRDIMQICREAFCEKELKTKAQRYMDNPIYKIGYERNDRETDHTTPSTAIAKKPEPAPAEQIKKPVVKKDFISAAERKAKESEDKYNNFVALCEQTPGIAQVVIGTVIKRIMKDNHIQRSSLLNTVEKIDIFTFTERHLKQPNEAELKELLDVLKADEIQEKTLRAVVGAARESQQNSKGVSR